jgi:hypothetical protein
MPVARRKADFPPSFRSFLSLSFLPTSRSREFCSGPTEPLYGACHHPLQGDSQSLLWTKPNTAYSSGNRIGFDKRIFSKAILLEIIYKIQLLKPYPQKSYQEHTIFLVHFWGWYYPTKQEIKTLPGFPESVIR